MGGGERQEYRMSLFHSAKISTLQPQKFCSTREARLRGMYSTCSTLCGLSLASIHSSESNRHIHT